MTYLVSYILVLPCLPLSSSVPPVKSLVVTELVVLFISSHLCFSLQFALVLSPLHLSVVNCCLDVVCLAHSCHHCKQSLSRVVFASDVNTSPFWQVLLNSFLSSTSKHQTSGYTDDPHPIKTSVTVTCLLSVTCPHLHHLYSIRVAIPLRTAGCERVNSWLEFTLAPSPICSVEWEITFSMRIIEHGQRGASSLPTNHREQGHLSRRQ